jgi:hypothetical protein
MKSASSDSSAEEDQPQVNVKKHQIKSSSSENSDSGEKDDQQVRKL